MKKLIMILIAIVTLQVSAQDQKREVRKQRMESKTPFTPEEIAQLQAKKMTLKLDLDEKQQKDVSALFLEKAKLKQGKKEAFLKSKENAERKSLSKEERFKMANAKLDQQIEMNKKMKTILSSDQYEKWGKMNEKRSHQGKRHTMMHSKSKQDEMLHKKSKQ